MKKEEPDYVVAHYYSNNHKEQLQKDEKCGCFDCRKIFEPKEITEWLEDDNPCDKYGTAKCPYCGTDSGLNAKVNATKWGPK